MEEFVIEGGIPLQGEVTPSGNKNAALPLLAACLLTAEPVVLHNIPQIRDVLSMRKLIESVGAKVEELDSNTWRITSKELFASHLDPDLCRRIRASILLAGPVLARTGGIKLPPPGGDVIGRRRLDTHIFALRSLGAKITYNRVFDITSNGLQGADILLDEASVTATENAVMAAVLAKGETKIRNAASEPHIQELCNFLNLLGAKIVGVGSNTLHIVGVSQLHGGEFTIGPDLLEVVSYIGAAVVTRGNIRIRNAGVQHLEMVAQVFHRLGVHWITEGNDIHVPSEQSLKIISDLDEI